jgi:hypothetical protein
MTASARVFARIDEIRAVSRLPLSSATSDEHRNALLSARILARVADGAALDAAFDAVLGPGARDTAVDALYTDLRAKLAPSAGAP